MALAGLEPIESGPPKKTPQKKIPETEASDPTSREAQLRRLAEMLASQNDSEMYVLLSSSPASVFLTQSSLCCTAVVHLPSIIKPARLPVPSKRLPAYKLVVAF